MNRRRRTLLLGLALVALLLAGGVRVALLWPAPSDAEHWAVLIGVGLTESQELELERHYVGGKDSLGGWQFFYRFTDGSELSVKYYATGGARTHTFPPPPVHPLTRVLPFLGE
jgi:hypothetical protein